MGWRRVDWAWPQARWRSTPSSIARKRSAWALSIVLFCRCAPDLRKDVAGFFRVILHASLSLELVSCLLKEWYGVVGVSNAAMSPFRSIESFTFIFWHSLDDQWRLMFSIRERAAKNAGNSRCAVLSAVGTVGRTKLSETRRSKARHIAVHTSSHPVQYIDQTFSCGMYGCGLLYVYITMVLSLARQILGPWFIGKSLLVIQSNFVQWYNLRIFNLIYYIFTQGTDISHLPSWWQHWGGSCSSPTNLEEGCSLQKRYLDQPNFLSLGLCVYCLWMQLAISVTTTLHHTWVFCCPKVQHTLDQVSLR